MSTEEKGRLIGCIISHLRVAAKQANRPFDEGTLFFQLVFLTDDDLTRIYNLSCK